MPALLVGGGGELKTHMLYKKSDIRNLKHAHYYREITEFVEFVPSLDGMSLNFRVIQIILRSGLKSMHPPLWMHFEYNFATYWNSAPVEIIKRILLLTTETMWSRPLTGALRWSCICVDLTFPTKKNGQWTDTRCHTLKHLPPKTWTLNLPSPTTGYQTSFQKQT